MNIYGHMVAYNEADRYLSDVLIWHARFLDGFHVYDDDSTDLTFEIADQAPNTVAESRPEGVSSFLEDESSFRQAAWESMERMLRPTSEDWILCIDADEFLVSDSDERAGLEGLIEAASAVGAVKLKIDEIFAVSSDGLPWKRVDGFWDEISGVRLVRYVPGSVFKARKMGGGSVPVLGPDAPLDMTQEPTRILHYGYARAEDQAEKYLRYSNLDNNGHSRKHINSILDEPTLEPVDVRVPPC